MKIVCLLIVIFLSSLAFGQIKVKVAYTPISNLIYQLDCVSGNLGNKCSTKNYTLFWEKRFIKSEKDKKFVVQWGNLMRRYNKQLELKRSEHYPITGRFEGVDLRKKIRIASFKSDNPKDYFDKLDMVVIPSDRTKIERIVNNFYPKFSKWWVKNGKPTGEPFSLKTEKLLKNEKIKEKLEQFYKFYEVDLPKNYFVTLNLFYRPELVKEPTSGQQVENFSTSEFLQKETPENRLDVVVHELCHFFIENSNQKKFYKFHNKMMSKKGVSAKASYNLLNESIATAFGNGIVSRLFKSKEQWDKYVARKLSFYNDYYIDKSARAIMPFLETWIRSGKTMYSAGFMAKYLSILSLTFKKELEAPHLVLTEMMLLADSKYGGEFSKHVHKAVRTSSMYTSEGSWDDKRFLQAYNKRNGKLNTLLIVHPENLEKIIENKLLPTEKVNEIMKSFKKRDEVIYAFSRDNGFVFYVIVAKTYKKAIGAVDKLGSLKSSFEGLLN